MSANEPPTSPDFRAVFDGLPGPYMLFDPSFTIVAVSDAHLQATMKKRWEVLGRSVFDVFPENPDDSATASSASLRASLNRVLRNRATDVMPVLKYDIQRPESEGGGYVARYWTPTNSPIIGPDGEVAYIINRVEDVTSYVLMQHEQKKQVQLTESLQAKAQAMESEIFIHAEATARANQELLVEIERRRSAQVQLALETEKLSKANAALIAMQHSREQLTGMIIHDLRNPLTASIGFLDLLTVKLQGADPAIKGYLKNATTVNLSLMEMINGIIDVMRMEDDKMPVRATATDVGAIIESKVQEFRGACVRGNLSIAYKGPGDLTFTTDGTLLGRVIDNLVVNAIKHTPRGGSVTISAHHNAQGSLVLRISDTGEGIAPDDLKRLFQKYGRVEGQTMGRKYDTGLGLVFCRMAIDLLHGTITVESELGKGSTFIIELSGGPPPNVDNLALAGN